MKKKGQIKPKVYSRNRRKKKIRSVISGTSSRPRLSVFKSNKYIYAQLINDDTGKTICAASSHSLKGKPLQKAERVGELIGSMALEKKIKSVVFDRGGFLYSGHIKALADGARKSGLVF